MRSRGAINDVNGDGTDGTLVIGVAVHETETEEKMPEHDGQLADASAGNGTNVLDQDSAQASAGDDVPPPSAKRLSISMRTEVTAVASASAKTESRSRSGSVNKLRAKLPLRSQPSVPDAKAATAPASQPATTDEGEKADTPPAEVKNEDEKKMTKLNRRLSSLAKSFSQTLRRRKSGEKSKEKENSTKETKSDPSLATTTSSTSAEGEPPSPHQVPPVPALPDAATVPLPPSPGSTRTTLVKKTSSGLLSPDMVPLPASPIASAFPPSVQASAPMKIEMDGRAGDKASVRSNATTQPASPDESESASVPILERLEDVKKDEAPKDEGAGTDARLSDLKDGVKPVEPQKSGVLPESADPTPAISSTSSPILDTVTERPSAEVSTDSHQETTQDDGAASPAASL